MAVLRKCSLACMVAIAGASALGCGTVRPVALRPEPIPYVDTLPIDQPASREPLEVIQLMRDAIAGEVAKGISLRRLLDKSHEAVNITRFDDVVNSAWFEHRNDERKLTASEIFRGPTTGLGPDTTGALTLTQAKLQGISPGFHVEDSRGSRYVVKFDPKGFQYLSSAAGVIANRFLHASGYNVPEDYIFRFRREQITGVEEGATYRDEDFVEHPLTLSLVDEILARVDTLPDGRFLAVASKYVPGPPLGPFSFSGTRDDDPNDWYVHEHRRDLRGLYVVSSWLNHVDMRFANTMDAFVEPGYVRHYLIDFAASLGSGTIRPHYAREGAEYNFDWWPTLARMATLGLYRQGWEGKEYDVIDPSIGWLQVETFDPGIWKANWPNEAFSNVTTRDGYWGAKLVGAFSDEQIRAAVDAGELPNELAADTLADILCFRRDRIVEYWYSRVSPIENPRVIATVAPEPELTISFEDFGIRDGAWTADSVSYAWEFRHPQLDRTSDGVAHAQGGYRQSIRVSFSETGKEWKEGLDLSDEQRIAILRITLSGHESLHGRAAIVYLLWDERLSRYRVAGLEH